MKTKLIILMFIAFGIINLIYAQDTSNDLQGTLEQLSGTAGKSYVDPFAQAVATDFNGGWFHKVPKAEIFGWDLEFGVVAMGSFFNSDKKTFETEHAKFRFTRDQATQIVEKPSDMPDEVYQAFIDQFIQTDFTVGIYGPTIIGDKYDEETGANGIHVVFPTKTVTYDINGLPVSVNVPEYDYPLQIGGLLSDLPAMPLVAPQLTLGTAAGTQICIRYLPETTIDETIGKISYMGYGIQHNPAVWLPFKIPVDVALAFFTQNLKVGELAELSGTTVGLNVAKTFGLKMLSVTPYAGIAAESAKMKFHYDYEVQTLAGPMTNRIAFEIEGQNTTRATLGLNFRLGIINLNVDYNLGKYQSATAGFMFNFSF
jgi:hypothetical protein